MDMDKLTIKEMQDKKDELEKVIQTAIREFEKEVANVEGISLIQKVHADAESYVNIELANPFATKK